MHLISPEVLAEAKGLTVVPCVVGLLLGYCLWVFGWRMHRFWLVLFATLGAGLYGLSYGPSHGVQALVAGLLLAIAAGVLVLDMVRILGFLGGAVTVQMLMRKFAPAWNEPFLFWFVGGFSALFLLRYWLMTLFSLLGSMILFHAGLCLIDKLSRKFDAVAWSWAHLGLLDLLIGGSTALGLMTQFYLERRREKKLGQKGDNPDVLPMKEGGSKKWWQWWKPAAPAKTKKAA